jgi:hypothetical protein
VHCPALEVFILPFSPGWTKRSVMRAAAESDKKVNSHGNGVLKVKSMSSFFTLHALKISCSFSLIKLPFS